MKKYTKALITVIDIIIIIVCTFLCFYIPGNKIGGIDTISSESQVIIRQNTYTRKASDTGLDFEHSVTEHELSAKQIEMLKEYLLKNGYTRSLRSLLTHNTTNMESYHLYDIVINDSGFVSLHNSTIISISWGYISGFRQSSAGWLKITDLNWEESILRILMSS